MSYNIITYHEDRGLEEFTDIGALDSLEEDTRVWVDIHEDEETSLVEFANRFGLHELSIEDCLDPGHFPKIEDYGNHLFLIFRGLKPSFYIDSIDDEDSDELTEEEKYTRKVALFVSEDFIISFRRAEIPWLDAVMRQVRQVPERTIANSTMALAHKIVDVLTDRFRRGIDVFEREIQSLEDKVLEKPDEFDLSDLLDIKRGLLLIRQIMRKQRSIVSQLSVESSLVSEKQQRRFFKDIDDHALAIIVSIDQYIDSLSGIRDAYFAISNVRLGDIMRILAVITTVAVPLNIVVGLYGMNFEAIPLLHNPNGFWFILSVMFALAMLLLLFFRKQRWI